MGDGHHGWAAAEIVLAVRDAFVYEREKHDSIGHEVVFFSGIPEHWFREGITFRIRNAPIPGARISMEATTSNEATIIDILFDPIDSNHSGVWTLHFPFHSDDILSDKETCKSFSLGNGETLVKVEPRSQRLVVRHQTGP